MKYREHSAKKAYLMMITRLEPEFKFFKVADDYTVGKRGLDGDGADYLILRFSTRTQFDDNPEVSGAHWRMPLDYRFISKQRAIELSKLPDKDFINVSRRMLRMDMEHAIIDIIDHEK